MGAPYPVAGWLALVGAVGRAAGAGLLDVRRSRPLSILVALHLPQRSEKSSGAGQQMAQPPVPPALIQPSWLVTALLFSTLSYTSLPEEQIISN